MLIENIAAKLGYSGGMEFGSDPYFPYIDHIAPAVMLLSDSSILAVLRARGAPFSLVMNRERNAYKRRLVAFLNAIADENVEVFIHLVKHDASLPDARHHDAVTAYARVVLTEYHASIEPDLAVLDWFISIRVKPRLPPFSGLAERFGPVLKLLGLTGRTHGVDPRIEVQLEDAIRLAFGTLEPFGLTRLGTRSEPASDEEGEPLIYSEIAEFLYLLRTTQFSPQPIADVLGFLGAGIAAVDVKALPQSAILQIDHAGGGSAAFRTHAAVIGLASYPRRIDQSRFDEVMGLPCRFVMSLAIRFQSRAESQDRLALLQRRLISANSRAAEDTDALDEAINEIAGGRSESAITRWSLVLHAGTPAEIDSMISAARTAIVNAGAKTWVERAGRLNAFLAQLPGAPAQTWIRPARCNTKQISVLASINGYARGPGTPRWDSHLFRLISPAGTAYDHDLFVGDVGHNFLGGPNGGGKSVWLGMNIIAPDCAVRRKGGTQIVLDVDESNHNTVMMLGGRYSTIEVGKSGLAPLRGFPDTPRVRAFLRDLIAGLVQTDGAAQPTKSERDGIRQGVDFVMGEMAPEERSFATIRSFVGFEENGAGERLEPWCRGHELGWVFDGEVHTVDFNTPLVGVDLTAVMDDRRIMPPLALTLLWMASDVMDGRRVVIWCEEAPAYMPTPAFAKPFKGIALRARKRNASFNAIAQQPSDMLSNEAGHALVKQARQFILFRNDKAVREDYVGGLGLTPAEFMAINEKMFSLPYHSVLIKRQDQQSGVFKFDLSSLNQHLNILSGTPARVRLLRRSMVNHPGNLEAAFLEFQARIHEAAA